MTLQRNQELAAAATAIADDIATEYACPQVAERGSQRWQALAPTRPEELFTKLAYNDRRQR